MFSESDYPQTKFPSSAFIAPEGPIGAPIMVIGEAPTHYDDMGDTLPDGTVVHHNFSGPAGKTLDRFFRKVGIDRSEVYLTNLIKRMPNQRGDMSTKDARIEVANNVNALRKEIRAVKPRVIVPLGNTVLEALGIRWTVGQCRGYIIPTTYGKLIPTWHPNAIFKQYHERVTAEKDWAKIVRQSNTVSIPQFPENFDLNPTIDDVERFELLVNNKVKSGQKVSVALDLETYYLDGSPLNNPIKLVGLAINKTHALVIPFIDQSENLYWEKEDEELRAWTTIGNLLENPNIEIMSHNSLFDIQVLMNHGFKVKARLYDTMLAQTLVYHPSKHGLDYVASIYTDFPPWKLTMGHGDEDFRYYNAKDATVLHYIRPGLDEDIRDNHLTHVCDIVMNVIEPTCQMMINGLSINQEAYDNIRAELEIKIEELTQTLRGLAGNVSFNPNSTAQVADLLFNKHKLKSGVKTKAGKKSTDDGVLNRLSLRYPGNELVEALQQYRHYAQQYKTFIKNLYIHVDGRVHSQFKLHRATTGRYSSSDPNLQNLPARTDSDGFIRGLYRVPEGNVLVGADYSQLELIIFAVLAQDEIWLDAFKHNKDIHVINGKGLLKSYYDPKYRTFTKNFIYGLVYGSEGGEVEKVAPKELIQHISVPQMMNNLRSTHPALFTYREQIESQVNSKKWVANAYGRRRWFPVMSMSKKNYREAYNHPIQGTAADIMHTRTPLLIEALNPETDKLVLQLHDAFYVETTERRRDEVARILKQVMEQHIETPMGYEFDLRADVEIGVSLSKKDMEEWKSI